MMTIQSKVPNDKYREEWDRIFGKFKERHPEIDTQNSEDYSKDQRDFWEQLEEDVPINPIVERNRELINPKGKK